MAQALPTLFVDDTAQTALEARVPAYVADTGMTMGASNSPGIGISTENPNLEQSLFKATDGSGDLTTGSWTLLDQHGDARTAQIGQLIGGDGITADTDWPGSGGTEGTLPDAVIRFGTNPDNVNGVPVNTTPITIGNGADLVTTATGWEDAL